MMCIASRVAVILAITLLTGISSSKADPEPQPFDIDEYQWAYGRIIDSIEVVGNAKVRTFAILREMELREGEPLVAESMARDQRYISDLSPFARCVFTVEPVGDDRCLVRVTVTERSQLWLKLIYPVLDYDLNTERLEYGLKWRDRNFRKRLEDFNAEFLRDNDNNDSASLSWGTGWLGWKHIGLGARISYYHRDTPGPEPAILDQKRLSLGLSTPLTESRARFSQLLWGLSFADNNVGMDGVPSVDENVLSPTVGYRYDDRDSNIKPTYGHVVFVSLQTNRVFNGEGRSYYRLDNSLRLFRPLDQSTVLGLYSNLSYQFDRYPSYVRFGMGGPGTVRGFEDARFRSAHRWIQTAEVRIYPWPKRFYKLPFVGLSDFTPALVAFVDAGIGWTDTNDFDLDKWHVGTGFGFRLYSPFQDVVRLDFGLSRQGPVRTYLSTGVRF